MNEETLTCHCGAVITRPVGSSSVCGTCGKEMGSSMPVENSAPVISSEVVVAKALEIKAGLIEALLACARAIGNADTNATLINCSLNDDIKTAAEMLRFNATSGKDGLLTIKMQDRA